MALGASIACAALAVALVGVDLAYNIEAKLEYRAKDGSWVTMDQSGSEDDWYARPVAAGSCGGPEWRLVVHNGQPWSQTLDVQVTYDRYDNSAPSPFRESWNLPSGASRSHEFTIPAATFTSSTGTDDGKTPPPSLWVTAQVGRDIHLSGCATAKVPEAAA